LRQHRVASELVTIIMEINNHLKRMISIVMIN